MVQKASLKKVYDEALKHPYPDENEQDPHKIVMGCLGLVFRESKKWLWDYHRTDEQLSVAFEGVVRAMNTYIPGKGSSRPTWALMYAKGALQRMYQREKRNSRNIAFSLDDKSGSEDGDGNEKSTLIPDPFAPAPYKEALKREDVNRVREALPRVQDPQRRMVIKLYNGIGCDKRNFRDIAEITGTSHQAVSAAYREGLKDLKELLKEGYEHLPVAYYPESVRKEASEMAESELSYETALDIALYNKTVREGVTNTLRFYSICRGCGKYVLKTRFEEGSPVCATCGTSTWKVAETPVEEVAETAAEIRNRIHKGFRNCVICGETKSRDSFGVFPKGTVKSLCMECEDKGISIYTGKALKKKHGERTCCKCGVRKSSDEFHRTPGGYRGRKCGDCSSIRP